MSYYFSAEELIGRYPAVAKNFDANALGSHWIPAASGAVDGYFGVLYSAPFSVVPYAAKDLAIDIAYYKMTYREQNQKLLKEYIDERILEIQERKIALYLPDGTLLQPNVVQVALTTSGVGTSFGMDSDTYFRVDSSWQMQYASDRGYPSEGY
jgi:phage gp36-like protein